MNRTLILSVVLLAASIAEPVSAALIERDWKVPGDGLLTYDDLSQREWLDLSVSKFNQFPEPRLENAIAQIESGGLFDGFTWAKEFDVRNFAISAGIDTSTSNIAVNQAATTNLINLIGPTFQSAQFLRSIALINEMQDDHLNAPPYNGAAFLVNSGGFAGLFFSLSDDELRAANGLMLYRNVPEPNGT